MKRRVFIYSGAAAAVLTPRLSRTAESGVRGIHGLALTRCAMVGSDER